MAEDLASLVIGLRADVATLQEDLRKASEANKEYAAKSAGYWQDASAAISQAFGGVSTFAQGTAKAALAAFGATGITDFAVRVVEATSKLSDLSEVTGISATVLSSYEAVAAESGTTVEDLSKTFGKFSKQINDAAHNISGPAANAFKQLGVSVRNDADGSLRDSQEILADATKKFSALGAGAGRAAISMQLFGKNGQEMIPVLTAFGVNMDSVQKKSQDLGLVVDQSTVESFKKLHDVATDLGLALKGGMLTVLREIAPELARLGDVTLAGLIRWFGEFKLAVIEVRLVIDDIIAFGHSVAEAFTEMTDTGGRFAGIDIKHSPLTEGMRGLPQLLAETAISFNNLVFAAQRFVITMKFDIAKIFNSIKANPGNLLAAIMPGGAGGMLPGSQATIDQTKEYDKAMQDAKKSTDEANQSDVDFWKGTQITADGISALRTETDKFILSLKGGKLSTADEAKELAKLAQMGGVFIKAGADVDTVTRAESASVRDLGFAAAESAKKQSDGFGVVNDKLLKAQQAYDAAALSAAKFLVGITAGLDPVQDAYNKYVDTLISAQAQADTLVKDAELEVAKGGSQVELLKARAAAQEVLTQAQASGNLVLEDSLAKLAKESDLIIAISADYNNQVSLIGLDARETAIQTAVNKETDAWHKLDDAHKAAAGSLDDVQKFAAQTAAAIYDLTLAAKLNTEAATQFESIWAQAGNTLADNLGKAIVEGESLMKDLANLAKQVVEEIISYFAKLAVINPILNSIFGGSQGFNLLPTLGNLFGGGTGAVAAAAATYAGSFNMGGPSGPTSYNAGSNAFSVASNGANIFSAGKTLFSGFQNALLGSGSGGSSIFGTSIGGDFGSTFTPSLFGGIAAGAGGLYAGYNEFQNAGGGAAGLAGGAAYGVGTTAIGLGLASAASGGGLIAGLSFLGPVGWAGIALMAVDMLSGGKLFGTAGKFNFGQTALTIGPTGATATAGFDVKGQAPLFGGSTHDWHTVQPSQAAIDAANQFYAALLGGVDNFAKQFGVKAGAIVGGQFIQNFDAKGNPTTSSSTVLGQTYNDTATQFQERIIAENELAVLGQFDKNLDAAVNQFRSNADTLAAITGSLATAELAMQGGTKFLALGTDQSLSSLLKLAEGAQQFGESIDQTLQRIVQAQQAYDQFVGQFKNNSFVDDFEKSISGITTAMNANIKQANALAIAAGAAGASQEDLANIEKYAAAQAAQALVALEASAQSLAFGLGLTVQGSLSDVSSEIQSLQAKANAGANPINSFGNAMQTAAQKATDAMNLLLGDLSPLNDQQKLQRALEGLRSGSVTADQVLQIGRRLYASTQAYSDLFNTVMAIGSHATSTGAGGLTGGATHAGLTGAEQARLSDLLKEQASLQAAATLQQYQTLAQQVAEIASAKGEDWQQVLKDMGVNIADFEKGLSLSDSQTGDYIDAIQKQTDSNGDNTKSLIDAINRLIVALGGTVPTDGTEVINGGHAPGTISLNLHDVPFPANGVYGPGAQPRVPPPATPPPTPPVVPPGHGGHGTDAMDPQTAQMLGRAFARGAGVLGSRSSRPAGRSSARI